MCDEENDDADDRLCGANDFAVCFLFGSGCAFPDSRSIRLPGSVFAFHPEENR